MHHHFPESPIRPGRIPFIPARYLILLFALVLSTGCKAHNPNLEVSNANAVQELDQPNQQPQDAEPEATGAIASEGQGQQAPAQSVTSARNHSEPQRKSAAPTSYFVAKEDLEDWRPTLVDPNEVVKIDTEHLFMAYETSAAPTTLPEGFAPTDTLEIRQGRLQFVVMKIDKAIDTTDALHAVIREVREKKRTNVPEGWVFDRFGVQSEAHGRIVWEDEEIYDGAVDGEIARLLGR